MYYNFSFDQYICYEIEEGIVKVGRHETNRYRTWSVFMSLFSRVNS